MPACAIGLRAHSGWAALVALAGSREEPRVVARSRLEIADLAIPGSRQPYHEAEDKPLPAARKYLDRCERATLRLASKALEAAKKDLEGQGLVPSTCALLLASGRPLPALESVLASHALIHTADGEHFRDALAAAAHDEGCTVVKFREREVAAMASKRLGISVPLLTRRIADMGKSFGPPWTQDQKLAALAAWLALAG